MCFRHKLLSVQFSPSCTPTRRNNIPPKVADNSYAKGIPTDSRGMPFLDKNLEPIGQRQFDRERRKIDETLRRYHNTPPAPPPST